MRFEYLWTEKASVGSKRSSHVRPIVFVKKTTVSDKSRELVSQPTGIPGFLNPLRAIYSALHELPRPFHAAADPVVSVVCSSYTGMMELRKEGGSGRILSGPSYIPGPVPGNSAPLVLIT